MKATIWCLFTLVSMSVLIEANLQNISEEASTNQIKETVTNESPAEKNRTNQLLGTSDTIVRRYILEGLPKAEWSPWGQWSTCSESCGIDGHQSRKRTCSAGPIESKHCAGRKHESRTCLVHCPVDGHWGSWSSYGACSVSCCTGSRLRTRSCDNPAPAYGGKKCTGGPRHSHPCINPCKGDAHLSSWGHWSSCSTSCGTGKKTRTRTCVGQSVCTGPCSGHTTEKSSYHRHCPDK